MCIRDSISPYQQQLVLLLPEAISNYREFIQNIYKVLQKKLRQNTLQIAIGGLVQFNKTQRSYRQAKLALAVCAWAAPEQRLNFYDDLGIFKLHGIDDINADIVSMCYTYIKPLIDYEAVSYTHLDVYKRQYILYIVFSRIVCKKAVDSPSDDQQPFAVWLDSDTFKLCF